MHGEQPRTPHHGWILFWLSGNMADPSHVIAAASVKCCNSKQIILAAMKSQREQSQKIDLHLLVRLQHCQHVLSKSRSPRVANSAGHKATSKWAGKHQDKHPGGCRTALWRSKQHSQQLPAGWASTPAGCCCRSGSCKHEASSAPCIGDTLHVWPQNLANLQENLQEPNNVCKQSNYNSRNQAPATWDASLPLCPWCCHFKEGISASGGRNLPGTTDNKKAPSPDPC